MLAFFDEAIAVDEFCKLHDGTAYTHTRDNLMKALSSSVSSAFSDVPERRKPR